MSLVWKLLRRHVSVPQFAGFFFANLLGTVSYTHLTLPTIA